MFRFIAIPITIVVIDGDGICDAAIPSIIQHAHLHSHQFKRMCIECVFSCLCYYSVICIVSTASALREQDIPPAVTCLFLNPSKS